MDSYLSAPQAASLPTQLASTRSHMSSFIDTEGDIDLVRHRRPRGSLLGRWFRLLPDGHVRTWAKEGPWSQSKEGSDAERIAGR